MKKMLCVLFAILIIALTVPSAFAYEGEARDVPQVRIITESGNGCNLQKEDGYVSAHITITDTDGTALEDDALIKVRGNSTALDWVMKKSFTFKYAKKKNVLQMGSAKKWALLANLFDPTLIRNYVGLETARALGLPYTSEQRIAELWLDGSYRGFYTLTEPIGNGKDRVNINTDNDEFIIEYEATRNEDDVVYVKTGNLRFAVKEPSAPSESQLSFISETMTDLINTLKTGSKAEITAKIDLDSFVRFYLLNEYLKTVDFGFSSVFFYYKNGVLYAGPAWDYDLSGGNSNPDLTASTANAYVTEGMYANEKNLYSILCSYDWFNYEAKKTYEEYAGVFQNIYADNGLIDTVSTDYRVVIDRNYSAAGWSVSRYWVNVQKKPLATYDENLNYYREWCADRDQWLTAYFGEQEYYLKGDSDGDNTVTVLDATNIQKYLACLITDYDEMTLTRSKTSDEALSIIDATVIQKYLAALGNPNRIDEMVKVADKA